MKGEGDFIGDSSTDGGLSVGIEVFKGSNGYDVAVDLSCDILNKGSAKFWGFWSGDVVIRWEFDQISCNGSSKSLF